MRKYRWHIVLGLTLVGLSVVTYYVQVLVFRRAADTFFYILQDFAFVPIQVLLVTLILDELLSQRERNRIRHKMNMVIGAFFSAVGDDLLKMLVAFDAGVDSMRQALIARPDSTRRDFAAAFALAKDRTYEIDSRRAPLDDLRALLSRTQPFVLGLLENQNLLEHESFADLLWAVTHLTEELEHRHDLAALPESDYRHLSGDIERAYRALIGQWLLYVMHLKDQYPYIFSLVMRTNPFDAEAMVEVS